MDRGGKEMEREREREGGGGGGGGKWRWREEREIRTQVLNARYGGRERYIYTYIYTYIYMEDRRGREMSRDGGDLYTGVECLEII